MSKQLSKVQTLYGGDIERGLEHNIHWKRIERNLAVGTVPLDETSDQSQEAQVLKVIIGTQDKMRQNLLIVLPKDCYTEDFFVSEAGYKNVYTTQQDLKDTLVHMLSGMEELVSIDQRFIHALKRSNIIAYDDINHNEKAVGQMKYFENQFIETLQENIIEITKVIDDNENSDEKSDLMQAAEEIATFDLNDSGFDDVINTYKDEFSLLNKDYLKNRIVQGKLSNIFNKICSLFENMETIYDKYRDDTCISYRVE